MCREITDEPLLICPDSGNDAAQNTGILEEAGCYFIIKRKFVRKAKQTGCRWHRRTAWMLNVPVKGKTSASAVTGSLLPIKQKMERKNNYRSYWV